MSSWIVCKRILNQVLKEKFSFLIMVFLPGFMILGFWMAFSTTTSFTTTTYDIIAINNDEGLTEQAKATLGLYPNTSQDVLDYGYAYEFIQIMKDTNYPQSNISIFSINQDYENLEDAKREIESRTIDAIVIFPKNFSNVTLSAINQVNYIRTGFYIPNFPRGQNGTLEIIGDQDFLNFQIADMILKQFFTKYEDSITSLGLKGGEIQAEFESVQFGEELSVFEQIIPGLMVMAIVMQSGIISAILTEETSYPNRTIERLRISRLKPTEYLIGIIMAQLLVVPVQLVILFGLSFVLGFRPPGNFVDAFLILWITSIFALGLLFIGAAIFKTGDATGQALGFLSMPVGFASGAFMTPPKLTLLSNVFPTPTGQVRDLLIWDLLPTTHAVNATQSILLGNYSMLDVLPDIIASLAISLLIIAIGMYFYIKNRYLGDEA